MAYAQFVELDNNNSKSRASSRSSKNKSTLSSKSSRNKNSSTPSPRISNLKNQNQNIKKVERRLASTSLPVERAMTRTEFLKIIKSEFSTSPSKLRKELASLRAQINNTLAVVYDPWTVDLNSRYQEYTFLEKYNETSGSMKFGYLSPKGFQFQVFGDYFDPSEAGIMSSRTSELNYGLSLSQELLNGFGSDRYFRDIEATEKDGMAEMANAEATYLNQLLDLVEAGSSLFSAQCRMGDLNKLYAISRESLKASQIRRSAGTISVRDHLRIAEASLNVERQILAAEFEIASLLNRFNTIARRTRTKVDAVLKSGFECEDDVEALNQLQYTNRDKMVKVILAHPSLMSLELQKEANGKRLESFQVQNRPSLKIETSYTKVQEKAPIEPYDDYYIGISFSYRFRDESYKSREENFNLEKRRILIEKEQTRLDLESLIYNIYDRLEYLKKQIPVANQSLINNKRILKIIETQQEIGELDATALEIAFSNYISSVNSIRDIWAQTASLVQRLNEIEASTNWLETL
jgi:outer membrane protein TolC